MYIYVCMYMYIDGSQSGGPWGGMKGFGLGLGIDCIFKFITIHKYIYMYDM
jgi:hypothetical protein